MNEPRPQRPPRPDEDLERFHNGDTLDNIPIIKVRARRWKPALAAVASLILLGSGYALVAHPKGTRHNATTHAASPAPKTAAPTVTVTAKATHTSSPTPTPSPSSAPSASPSTLAEPACINVRFKMANGPQLCEPKTDVCQLGSPMYLPTIDDLCGPAPIARVYVPNTDVVEVGGCLALRSTSWATATAEYEGAGAAAAECAAFVDETELDGGARFIFCQATYPDTRATFLAAITTPAGTTSACLTANNGA